MKHTLTVLFLFLFLAPCAARAQKADAPAVPDLEGFASDIARVVVADYGTSDCARSRNPSVCYQWVARLEELVQMHSALHPGAPSFDRQAMNPCAGHIEDRLIEISEELQALVPDIRSRKRRQKLRAILDRMARPFGAIHC